MRRVQRALFGLFLGLVAVASVAYAAIAVLVLIDALDGGPWQLLGVGVLLVFLFVIGGVVLRGFYGRETLLQRVHHSSDPQTLIIRNRQ